MNITQQDLEDSKITYLTLTRDIILDDDKSYIIFAANGTCKTTLFNYIYNTNKDNVCPYIYNCDIDSSFNFGKNKELIINIGGIKKEKISNEINSIVGNLDIDKKIKSIYGTFSKKGLVSFYGGKNIYEMITSVESFSYRQPNDDVIKKLQFIFDNNEDKKLFFKKIKEIKDLGKEKELVIKQIISPEVISFFSNYDVDANKENIRINGCPICGSKGENILEQIIKMRDKVLNEEKTLFNEFNFAKINSEKAVSENIETLLEVVKDIKEEDVPSLVLYSCFDDPKKLNDEFDSLSSKRNELSMLEAQQKAFYAEIKNRETLFKEELEKQFGISSVSFDDSNYLVKLKLDRQAITFSEGEKHEIYAILKFMTVIGSDKNIVIADDPLTELDDANQYKSVFRFLQLSKDYGKQIIIFTCNPNLINIMYQYDSKAFHYVYCDNTNINDICKEIRTYDIDEIINYKSKNSIFSLKNFELPKSNDIFNKAVAILSARAKLEIIDKNDANYKNACDIFHYKQSFKGTINVNGIDIVLSNDELCNLIEQFNSNNHDFNETKFYNICIIKITYLIALRVFIEKKIRDYDNFLIKKGKKSFLKDAVITKNYITLADNNDIKTYYKNWNKPFLMMSKTMLNDNDHPYSQILPVSYALSISSYSIINDILIIKNIFSI